MRASLAALLLLAATLTTITAEADIFVSEGTNISVDVAPDGRLATDLLGGLWIIPKDGGMATALASGQPGASRPRWSADGNALVFEANTASLPELRVYDFDTQKSEPVSDPQYASYAPDWHPDGKRIVFSSARNDQGLDLWETDIASRTSWRLTALPGDEMEPAWSANGEDLLYVHRRGEQWMLVLKRRGRVAEILHQSGDRIAAPGWRPDGSLVTFLQQSADGWHVKMTILSQPRLTRTLISNEDFFIAPIAWRDRQHMVYPAGGHLRLRGFNSWTSTTIPFQANVGSASGYARPEASPRPLRAENPATGRRIIRATHLYDGMGATLSDNLDVIIDDGVISAVEPRRDRTDGIVVDLGDATIMPGFIDAYAGLPRDANASLGPLILALGVTTLVTDHPQATELNQTWSGKALPGPRVLRARSIDSASTDQPYPWLITLDGGRQTAAGLRSAVQDWQKRGVAVLANSWQAALGSGAALLLGTDTRPRSPRGLHYQDVQLASGVGTITFVSGLASASTPGIDEIWDSRAAKAISASPESIRPFNEPAGLAAAAPLLVVGSQPNGLPAGIALHAEFRALAHAGLRNEQVLRAAGVNAAAALGFGLRLGRVSTGALADLVVVAGNPLATIEDSLKIIGVVRNGRFFSVSGLLDRSNAANIVE